MTLARRIIPCLDTDGARVVKGVNFVGLRDAGDPVALAARYNSEGADELVVLDIAASRDRRPTFLETIRRVAAELAIPLTAGGGIRTLDDARAVVQAGADKITVNTAAVLRPELISELAAEFGSQAVVLAIDAQRNNPALNEQNSNAASSNELGSNDPSSNASKLNVADSNAANQIPARWTVTVRGGAQLTSLDAVAWAIRGAELGAGEILLTSVDRDGTQSGFDIPLTAAISTQVNVPVIASGGAKLPQHFADIFRQGAADAALAASIFHDQVQPIRELKKFLAAQNIQVRLPC